MNAMNAFLAHGFQWYRNYKQHNIRITCDILQSMRTTANNSQHNCEGQMQYLYLRASTPNMANYTVSAATANHGVSLQL